ncbi:unnamed protein product [marine sediment metagenome]|uniref:Uncharacterized protein n=1 Tax=marine sediment metagenome TaxID=412755 RepID=X0W297_9ZZZZ
MAKFVHICGHLPYSVEQEKVVGETSILADDFPTELDAARWARRKGYIPWRYMQDSGPWTTYRYY